MKNRTGLVIAVVTAAVFTGCGKDSGMPKNTLATPEETVKAYCELDGGGARLTSQTWKKVLPYIAWSEEAGFDRAIVISGFAVGAAQRRNDGVSAVTVAYQVLGVVSGDYAASRKTENVRFKVAKTDRGWKIIEPDFMPPHVLAAAMAKHLEGTRMIELAEKVRNDR